MPRAPYSMALTADLDRLNVVGHSGHRPISKSMDPKYFSGFSLTWIQGRKNIRSAGALNVGR